MHNKILRIRNEETTLFGELNQTLLESFRELQKPNSSMSIFWKDDDDDRIGIQEQSGLLLAMESMGGPLYSLFVVFENNDTHG